MNITGLEVFILTFLIVAVLAIVILEKQSIKQDRIAEIRKSINAAAGPIVHGIIKVVFLIALIVVQFKMDFQNAMVFGIVGGICLGLMTYFFEPKTKRNKAIIISNNLKTLGIQFILIWINWYILWMESELTISVFSICTVPIYFLAGFLFLKPIEKRDYLSVIGLFALLFVDALVVVINSNIMIASEIVNPVCGWVFEGYSEILIFPQDIMCLILSIVPSLFLYFGIVARKKMRKRKGIEVEAALEL